MARAVESEPPLEFLAPRDDPDTHWLGEDLSGLADVEPFEWGSQGPPDGDPASFEPGVSFVTGGKGP